MSRFPAMAFLALALLLTARAAVDDAQCVASLTRALDSGGCDATEQDSSGAYVLEIATLRYKCPGTDCKESLALVNPACLAEGGRLADQVAAQLQTELNAFADAASGPPTTVTAQNV